MKRKTEPRYQAQIRSGTEWSWYSGSNDYETTVRDVHQARKVGYDARLVDTKLDPKKAV